MDSGSVPSGQVLSTQGDGSNLEAQIIVSEVCLPIGPLVGQVEEGPNINLPNPSHPATIGVSGCDLGLISARVGRAKIWGKRSKIPRPKIKGRDVQSSEFQRGKRKIEEVANFVNLGSQNQERLGSTMMR